MGIVIAWISFLSRDIIAKACSDNNFVSESKVGGQRIAYKEKEIGKNHQKLNFQVNGGKIRTILAWSSFISRDA